MIDSEWGDVILPKNVKQDGDSDEWGDVVLPQQQQPFQRPAYPQNRPGMGGVYATRETPETILPEPFRSAVRTGARALEATAGHIGDVGRFATGAVNIGRKIQEAGPLGNLPNPLTSIFPSLKKPAAIPEILSDEGFRKSVTEPMFGKKNITPESDAAQWMDKFTTVGTKAILPPFGLGAGKAALLGGTAATSKVLAKNYAPKGWDETISGLSTLGASLGMARYGKMFPEQVMSTAYEDLRTALDNPNVTQGLKLSTEAGRRAETLVDRVKNILPEKYAEFFRNINKNVADTGTVSGKDLYALKEALNENYGKMTAGSPKLAESFHTLRGELKEVLEHYGKEFNPDFLKNWKKADEMYGAIKGAKSISDFVGEHIGFLKKPMSKVLGGITGLIGVPTAGYMVGGGKGALVGAAASAAATAGVGAVYAAANPLFKDAQKIMASKEFANAYVKLLGDIARSNKTAAIKGMNTLNNLAIEKGF